VSRGAVRIVLASVGLVVLAFGALLLGEFPIPPDEVFRALWSGISGDEFGVPPAVRSAVWLIRVPRIGTSLLVGAALASAGATFQGVFRNPLVSPNILGVSTGAGLGAAVAILLGLPVVLIQGFAFATGIVTVALVYFLARAVGRAHSSVHVLVLAGVVTGSLMGAGISLVKFLADPHDELPAITFWLLGSLSSTTREDLVAVAPAFLIGLVPLVLLRWRINVLSLGDEEARALGVDVSRTRPILIAGATLMTASAVSVSGTVGWVGLVVPHLARMTVGPDFRRLLPASAIMGAGYLLVVDTAARTLMDVEFPLGVLTAVLGAPFFLWLLATSKKGWR